MRTVLKTFTAVCFAALTMTACKKETKSTAASEEISQEIIQKIQNLGFSTDLMKKVDGGYLVEGDIILTDANLNETTSGPAFRTASEEQYRTTNLVNVGASREITVSVTGLGTPYINGLDIAITRYNALGLRMTFRRITSGTGNINLVGFNEGPSGGYITLGSSGFPSGGNPYPQIKMNTNQYAYGSNPDVNYVGAVIMHEIGHCIGFRHTDYMNRAYSCGGRHYNEGSAGIGAVLIPGTPSKPDAESWMLACSNGGDRPFNYYDQVALNYLYK